jgi:hypothetical protein
MTKRVRSPEGEMQLAWIEELGREHARLGGVLTQISNLMSGPAEGLAKQLPLLLEEALSHCQQHMQYEERQGYLSGVMDRVPNVAETLETLRGEHAELLEELEARLAEARAAGSDRTMAATVVPRVRKWLERIRDHEIRENTLVQEAFNRDTGALD